jgi:hypothetical protein
MKTSSASNFRSLLGRIMMGLVLAAMIGSIDVAPALGKDNDGRHDSGRYEKRGHGNDRGHYVYRERVYLPPAVIYAPPEPPGIRIFFPPILIHP